MKYKVGDKVRIKSLDWYNKNKNSDGDVECDNYFSSPMKKYCGKIATIMKCHYFFYRLDIDGGYYNWTDEMFEEPYDENKMESKKVKINLPKNCEVDEVKASVENGFIVVEYIPRKKFVCKKGDIIYFMNKRGKSWICIYKYTNNNQFSLSFWDYCSIGIKSKILTEDSTYISEDEITEIRLATEEEKKILFDALEKKNLIWNAEENKLDKIMWIPKIGEIYFYIDGFLGVQYTQNDDDTADGVLFKAGNYFQTEEEAQEYADKFKELLKRK